MNTTFCVDARSQDAPVSIWFRIRGDDLEVRAAGKLNALPVE